MRFWTKEQYELFSKSIQKSAIKLTFDILFYSGIREGDDHVIIRLKLDKLSKYTMPSMYLFCFLLLAFKDKFRNVSRQCHKYVFSLLIRVFYSPDTYYLLTTVLYSKGFYIPFS